LKITDIRAFEDGLYKYFDSAQSDFLADLTKKKSFDDDLRNRLHAALKEYKENFKAQLQPEAVTRKNREQGTGSRQQGIESRLCDIGIRWFFLLPVP